MNLLHNAFKNTRAGGAVILRAHAEGQRLLVEIEDECGGIPGSKADLFQAFGYRRGLIAPGSVSVFRSPGGPSERTAGTSRSAICQAVAAFSRLTCRWLPETRASRKRLRVRRHPPSHPPSSPVQDGSQVVPTTDVDYSGPGTTVGVRLGASANFRIPGSKSSPARGPDFDISIEILALWPDFTWAAGAHRLQICAGCLDIGDVSAWHS